MSINKDDFIKSTVHCAVLPSEAVKIVRELQGLSKNDLAHLSGLSQRAISAIENGITSLGREKAIALAQALHVHPAVLLFPDFDMTQMSGTKLKTTYPIRHITKHSIHSHPK